MIRLAVWLYYRFTVSLRNVEDMLQERGIFGELRDGSLLGEQVRSRDCFAGKESVLADVDNMILITSKPPQEDRFHALVASGLDVRIIGDARVARWSVFAADEAIKDGRRAGMTV